MLWFPVGRKALSKYKMNFEKKKNESGEKKYSNSEMQLVLVTVSNKLWIGKFTEFNPERFCYALIQTT